MFEEFYHLTQNPFQINTDPRFLWLGEKHKEALAILQYGVLGNKSFLLLTGDVGTGKTTLINALLKGQGADTLIATIQDPDLSTLDLYNYIAYSFGMPDSFPTKGKFLEYFRKFLEGNYYNGKKVLLIIDEAQRMKQGILEDIRVLSNVEVDGNKLINIFFVGQNEFNNILFQDENKAIRQRITISYNIKPLTCHEVEKYIQFRLFKAGAKGRIFKKNAIKKIYDFTNGYPRLINILCDRCLLTGFVLGKKAIDSKTVKECCDEIDMSMPTSTVRQDIEQEDGHGDQSSSLGTLSRPMKFILVFVSLLVLAGVWFPYNKIKIMFPLFSSSGGSVQEGVATPNPPPALSRDHTSGESGLMQAVLRGMNHIVQGTVWNKENQSTREERAPSPSLSKDEVIASPSVPRAKSKVELDLLEEVDYERKMQIFFQPDSISPAPQYVDALKTYADRFQSLGQGQIVIRGYTDRSGTVRYNKKLAKFRADIIKTFLEGRGVDEEKIVTIGVNSETASGEGESFPAKMEGARRVELEIVLPTLSD